MPATFNPSGAGIVSALTWYLGAGSVVSYFGIFSIFVMFL